MLLYRTNQGRPPNAAIPGDRWKIRIIGEIGISNSRQEICNSVWNNPKNIQYHWCQRIDLDPQDKDTIDWTTVFGKTIHDCGCNERQFGCKHNL